MQVYYTYKCDVYTQINIIYYYVCSFYFLNHRLRRPTDGDTWKIKRFLIYTDDAHLFITARVASAQ
jgi:hypothetical protein